MIETSLLIMSNIDYTFWFSLYIFASYKIIFTWEYMSNITLNKKIFIVTNDNDIKEQSS